MHHPVDQPEQLSHVICIIPSPIQTANQLPLGTKTPLRVAGGPQRLDLGPRHLDRQRQVVLPFGLQLVDQLADGKSQAGLEVPHLEHVFAGAPVGVEIGQHDDADDPLVERPRQAAVEFRDPPLEPGFRRGLDFQVQQNPQGLAGKQPHFHQQIHALVAAARLSEDLADFLVVPLHGATPVNRGMNGRKVLREELGQVMPQALLPRAVVIAILLGHFALEIFDHAGPFPTNASCALPTIDGQRYRAGDTVCRPTAGFSACPDSLGVAVMTPPMASMISGLVDRDST